MSRDAAATCADLGPEVGRSWRRVIDHYRMPDGARVTEVLLSGDDIDLTKFIIEGQLGTDARTMLSAVDWHSQITVMIALL